jgi:multiple sugar transport system permease protein
MTTAAAPETARPAGPRARAAGGAAPRRRSDRTRPLRLHLPLALYLVFTLVPFYWMLLYAVRPDGAHGLAPWPLTLENFRTVWTGLGFAVFFENSALVGLGTLICTGVLAVMGGYAMARFRFRGRGAVLLALLCSQFVPGAMLLIPLFVLFHHLGLLDSLGCLVLADTAFQIPLSLLLMTGFVANLPVELEESAMVDGCSRPRAFLAVVLPLLGPGLVAVGALAFIGSWNNFLFALMFMSEQSRFTLPVGLSYNLGDNSVDFGALAAGGVIAAVPVVLVFAVVQRFMVRGLSAGAVKG